MPVDLPVGRDPGPIRGRRPAVAEVAPDRILRHLLPLFRHDRVPDRRRDRGFVQGFWGLITSSPAGQLGLSAGLSVSGDGNRRPLLAICVRNLPLHDITAGHILHDMRIRSRRKQQI